MLKLLKLLLPLAPDALEAIYRIVTHLKADPDGVTVAARREAEALAAKALIRR